MTLGPRHSKRHRAIRRYLRLFTRVQLIASISALAGAVLAVVSVIIVLNRPAQAPLGNAPPLLSTPTAGASAVSVPGVALPARLVIPAGHIDIRIVNGDGIHVPLNLALHYPGTSEPGSGSNSLFYAHARPGMFLGLYDLHVGDDVRLFRADGSQLLYQVRTLRKVAFNDVSVLKPTPFEEITLLTCTSYDPYNPRYIVTATPV